MNMTIGVNNTATEKHKIKREQGARLGTLYKLATNVDNHNIYLYKNVSESPREAAERFLMMHKCPFAAGGYAGRFLRAGFGLSFILNEQVEVEFQYILDQDGNLSASRHEPRKNAWDVLYEGLWYEFINHQDIAPERLHRVPSIKLGAYQIVTLLESRQQRRTLEYLVEQQDPPERFQEYLAFIAHLKP